MTGRIVGSLLAAVLTVILVFVITAFLKSWNMVEDTGGTLLGISALVAGFFFLFALITND